MAIIGSERHDSRRVDRQLRGRAGRQGDPGSSQFFVSLEDELMRLFGSERIVKVMDRMGYEEGEVIQHSMMTKSIERAQKKVEENNFGIRKRLLEYDDVMNRQREVIYAKRRHALFGERLQVDIQNSFYDLCEELVSTGQQTKNFEQFQLDVIRFFSLDSSITQDQLSRDNVQALSDRLFNEVMELYNRKQEQLREAIMPVLKQIHETRGDVVQRVAIPLNDGRRGMNVLVDLHEMIATEGKGLGGKFERVITLALIDDAWKHHLRAVDDLKQEVQLASYEQKDPIVIYKKEAFNLFSSMISSVNREIASFLFKGQVPQADPQQVRNMEQAQQEQQQYAKKIQEGRGEVEGDPSMQQNGGPQAPQQQVEKKPEPVRVGPKVGRNDPCPCGSGKKFKSCHGKDIVE